MLSLQHLMLRRACLGFSAIRSQLICKQALTANHELCYVTYRLVLLTLLNPVLDVFETFLTKTDHCFEVEKITICLPLLIE